MKDIEGIIRACGNFVALLDEHPRGAFTFVVVLIIICVAWRWPRHEKRGAEAPRA